MRQTISNPGLALLTAILVGGCGPSSMPPTPTGTPEEQLRARFGIPADARRVIVFAQTAHLDVDWQRTFDDYYTRFVGDIFTEARGILQAQPRASYSVAEMSYLKHHVEQHPDELPLLHDAAARGALRIVGGGMTSPDTVLPETEMLMHDYLYGARFAEDTLGARAHAAWLPDSFGHAATVPDLLAAVGLDSVGFARIDGAPTFTEALFHPDIGIKPGSNAAMLQQLGSADFLWRGPGGGTVLAHYMSTGLYCTGDNIDYDEQLQIPGSHLGVFYGDDPTFTDKQIDGYVASLTPYARTPYMFVPVGCDFQHPKDGLIGYLDGYDQRRFPSSGVYAVAATFEDYAALVRFHADSLPTMEADLTPYFTGFYGTRAGVKMAVRRAARPFLEAELFSTALGDAGQAIMAAASSDFELLLRADHHDFVTGTANDMVEQTEQLPLLATAQTAGDALLSSVASAIAKGIPAQAGSLGRALAFNPSGLSRSTTATVDVSFASPPADPSSLHALVNGSALPVEVLQTSGPNGAITGATIQIVLTAMPPFSWQTIDLVSGAMPATSGVTLQLLDGNGKPATGAAVAQVVLDNGHVHAVWKRGDGFALTSLTVDGTEAIVAPSFVVHDAADMGGLWRIGSEMKGCTFTPLAPAAIEQQGETAMVLLQSNARVGVSFVSSTATREAWLGAGDTGLDLALTTTATRGQTRTAQFTFSVAAGAPLRTSLAGGWADRTAMRIYTPTFWPAVSWASAGDWAVLLRQSTGVRFSSTGDLELMAVRDAEQESCDNEGGVGSDLSPHRIEWRIEHAASPAAAELSAQGFNRPLEMRVVTSGAGTTAAQRSLYSATGDGILSTAKPADRGEGIVIRAQLLPGPLTLQLPAEFVGRKLTRIDAAERDLEDLGTASATVTLDAAHFGSIASIRVH